jgi:imidazolonepropionase-like amidohydrolase
MWRRVAAAASIAAAAILTVAVAPGPLSPEAIATAAPAAMRSVGQGRGAQSITIRAARVLDGTGATLANGVVEIQGATIAAVDQRSGPVTYDLGSATLLPGLIDVHVHLNWYFGPDGRYGGRGVLPSYAADAILENMRATLMAGFTTVQSLGWAGDKGLRDAVASGAVNGPRILSSLGQMQGGTSTPDELRARVRQARSDGADVIKFFASASIRDGGKMNVTQAQLDAVCGEAKAVGLRTAIHAHSSESVIAAVKAGCGQIEHGLFVDDAAIKAMADARVFFDPNIGLVLQNYLEHREQYSGAGNFNDEGFATMKSVLPNGAAAFRKALAAGIRMPLGTDAVAGAHGQNAREIVARVVDGGQRPMDAIISATSLAAASLNLGDRIGAIKAGYEADLVAVAGDPIADITTLRQMTFVMRGGRLMKR